MSVDWDEPIEAVHEDGRVVAVEVSGSPDKRGDRVTTPDLDGVVGIWHENGAPWAASYPKREAMASWRIRNVAKAPQTGSTAPSPSEVGPEVDADEYNMTISMLLTAADLGHSVTLKPQGARTAAYAMMAVKQQTVHANEVSEMLVSLAREVASFSGADITFSERPGHSFNISSKARAIVALLPEPVDAIEAIARRLIDQHDEPWPQGTESDRLHYWRNKAIQAANDLRALEKEAGR